jgi:hypothetical protein
VPPPVICRILGWHNTCEGSRREEMKMERSPKNAVITVARSLGILMLVIGLQGGAQAHPPLREGR